MARKYVRNATPATPQAFAEQLRGEAQAQRLTPDRLHELTMAYASAADPNGAVGAQVRDQVERVLAQWLRDNGGAGRPPVDFGPGTSSARSALHSSTAPGAVLDKDFSDWSGFLNAVHPKFGDLDKQRAIRNAFSTGEPSKGGFLVPETLRSTLLELALEKAIVRPRATVIPMDSLRVPIPQVDDSSHASSVHGGIVGYWTEEGAALVEVDASFGRTVLDAKKLTAYTEVPNELIQDATPALDAYVRAAFPKAVAWFEDLAFLTGSGVGEPLGVLNAPAMITVNRATADLIDFADVVGMFSRMLPDSLTTAVWIASIDTLPQLLTLHAEPVTGQPVSPMLWLNNGSVAGAPPMTLLGRPVIFTEKVPKLTEPGALSFVDFGYYLLGDRMAMSVVASEHYKFQNDETAIRVIERVDGRPWVNSAITPYNGGSTLSPFVTIGT
jgi:HK97 family phage major capsid protein